MRLLALWILIVFVLAIPASAVEFTAPEVPESGRELMPERPETFGQGLMELLKDAIMLIRPDIRQAAITLTQVLQSFSGKAKNTCDLVGAVGIAGLLLVSTDSLIRLGTQTVTELSEYGKLLLPVMTGAMASQGGITTAAALYTGTSIFSSFLSSLISGLMIPMVYIFLALSAFEILSGVISLT